MSAIEKFLAACRAYKCIVGEPRWYWIRDTTDGFGDHEVPDDIGDAWRPHWQRLSDAWKRMSDLSVVTASEVKAAGYEPAVVFRILSSSRWDDYRAALAEAEPILRAAMLQTPSDPHSARRQKGVDAYNGGSTWREVTALLDGEKQTRRDQIQRVTAEIRRYANKTNQPLQKKLAGRKRGEK